MIKVDCKNVPDKWQRELCKINFLKLIKKNVSKNIFSRNSKLILFQWMISIYLFINKKFQLILNKLVDWIFIFILKETICNYFVKKIYYKISNWQ